MCIVYIKLEEVVMYLNRMNKYLLYKNREWAIIIMEISVILNISRTQIRISTPSIKMILLE